MEVVNLWGYLIEGIAQVLMFIVEQLPMPFADFQVILNNLPTMLYFAIAPLFILVGSFINLQIFMAVAIAVLILEGARAIVGLWRLILRMIPAAG